jgi:hypothetical protein
MATPPIIQGARHRGRMLATTESPSYVAGLLRQLGFGPYVAVWTTAARNEPGQQDPRKLPADWTTGTERVDSPPYWTFWFEADWTAPVAGVLVPLSNLNPPTAEQIANGAMDWRFHDLGPFCWMNQSMQPAYGLPWCAGMQPPPPQPQPPQPQPPEPAEPDAAPTRRPSPWLMLLGVLAVAVPVGVLVLHRSSPGRRRAAARA